MQTVLPYFLAVVLGAVVLGPLATVLAIVDRFRRHDAE
jgi:hypothetical protein